MNDVPNRKASRGLNKPMMAAMFTSAHAHTSAHWRLLAFTGLPSTRQLERADIVHDVAVLLHQVDVSVSPLRHRRRVLLVRLRPQLERRRRITNHSQSVRACRGPRPRAAGTGASAVSLQS